MAAVPAPLVALALVAVSCGSAATGPATGGESGTTVSVSGRVTADVGPPLGTVMLVVEANGKGPTDAALTGTGTHQAYVQGAFIESSTWQLDLGATNGAEVTLSGKIRSSLAAGLVDSPVALAANISGAITVTQGPIVGGPYIGQTHVFVGSGVTTITRK